jgi:fructose-specific phosphotransferase system IIC component
VTATHRLIAALFVGVLYAVSTIAAGHLLPGLVGGALAALLMWLVLQRLEERARARRRDRGEE